MPSSCPHDVGLSRPSTTSETTPRNGSKLEAESSLLSTQNCRNESTSMSRELQLVPQSEENAMRATSQTNSTTTRDPQPVEAETGACDVHNLLAAISTLKRRDKAQALSNRRLKEPTASRNRHLRRASTLLDPLAELLVSKRDHEAIGFGFET
ncbi:hypothetical protein AJ79_09855 [Helicocarpus griseus UAMH5409]|uniref:Uncharacterized protein n=1 Tax=Helicocarpus griseus UAMH5409 TaxID=1447875 RepID=A0A2B7WGT8_9EURO|nr:hypothetical protein AJ79_09855 [Helicocarpus griseus UAMH5409]